MTQIIALQGAAGPPVRAGAPCGFWGRGLFQVAGVALHSELGAQMAPKKPRPLQAASGTCTPQRLEAPPLQTGRKVFEKYLQTGRWRTETERH